MHARLRYLAGTARRRLSGRLRRTRRRVHRAPPCATAVPRPRPAGRREPSLRLSHVLLATDLNPRYLGLWPLARRAWSEIAGLEPLLVLVADREAVPAELAADDAVHVFEPEPSLHAVFQAQCVRLLYPALLDTGGAVLTSDIDMVPMSSLYFHRPLARIARSHFVCYRDAVLELGELPICYNAALPATWASVFSVSGLDDVRARLREWGDGVEYAGTRGGPGWTTDQRQLRRILLERGRAHRDVWILDDEFTRHRRLERAYIEKWGAVSADATRNIARRMFSDFHLVGADSPLAGLNELVVASAMEAAWGPSAGREPCTSASADRGGSPPGTVLGSRRARSMWRAHDARRPP